MYMTQDNIVTFLDIGTNSIRILIVRINKDRLCRVLTDQKMVVRLGQGEFESGHLTHEAIIRAENVLARFMHMAHNYKADNIIAVATSALREAKNQNEIIEQIYSRTGVRIQIISGIEEARLIWLGVSSGVELGEEKALFIDIGGGSTEIIVGNQYEPLFLRSLKLGAIRTTQSFLPVGYKKQYTSHIIEMMTNHIELEIAHTIRNLHKYQYSKAFGSSGTILALESIARSHKETSATHVHGVLTLQEIEKIIRILTHKSLEERRKIEGLIPERADIIIAGALILQKVLRQSGLKEIWMTERSLRDGLLKDYLIKNSEHESVQNISVRKQSVREMGEIFHINKEHGEHIKNLAIMLFDSGIDNRLFRLPPYYREILEYAAYLHDIGQLISYSRHHYHSYYLIRSVPLLGFTQDELILIALITRYHRKKIPRLKDEEYSDLNTNHQTAVRILSQLLRIAENLDRSHDRRIQTAAFIQYNEKQAIMEIECSDDYSLEWAAIQEDRGSFKKVFGLDLLITVSQTNQNSFVDTSISEITSES